MKEDKEYKHDIEVIRNMMERSTRFLSLSGWAGIMAGIYAFAGAWVASEVLGFDPDKLQYEYSGDYFNLFLLAFVVVVVAVITALVDSKRKAASRKVKAWNATSKRLLINMAVPLSAGGALIVILFLSGLTGLTAPLTLIFYGIALFSAGNFTFNELRIIGIVQIVLGLLNCWFIETGLLFWITGFGIIHMVYGIYMHIRYAK